MSERPFAEKSAKPTEAALKKTLGKSFSVYVEATGLAVDFKQDWNHGKSSGWMLKVHDRKKALYYLTPLNGSLMIGMAIRVKEWEALLLDEELAAIHDTLRSARKYSEGCAVRFTIAGKADFKSCGTLIRKLIERRS